MFAAKFATGQRRYRPALCGLVVVLLPGAALANTPVTETGTRQQLTSPADTPAYVSLSRFDNLQLRHRQIHELMDLQALVPHMHLAPDALGRPNLSLRGIGRFSDNPTADSALGVTLNNVQILDAALLDQVFYDMAGIELKRGPQGSQRGANNIGGTLVLQPNMPHQAFSTDLNLSYGRFSEQHLQAHVNLPLTADLAVRLAGSRLTRDGTSDNPLQATPVDDRDQYSFRTSLSWWLSEARFDLTYQQLRVDDRRLRATAQRCRTDNQPWPFNRGCDPDRRFTVGELPNSQGTQAGQLASHFDLSLGAEPGGWYLLPADTDAFADSVGASNARVRPSEFGPRLRMEEDLVVGSYQRSWQGWNLWYGLAAQEQRYANLQDLHWALPSVSFTADIPGFTDSAGNLDVVTDPSISGRDSLRSYERISYEQSYRRMELQLDTPDYGRWYALGGISLSQHRMTDFSQAQHHNVLSTINQVLGNELGGAGAGAALQHRIDLLNRDRSGIYGEVYVRANDRIRVMVGLQRVDERMRIKDQQAGLTDPALAPGDPAAATAGLPYLNGAHDFFDAEFGIDDVRFHGFTVFGNNPSRPARRNDSFDTNLNSRLGADFLLNLPYTDYALAYGQIGRSHRSAGFNRQSPAAANNMAAGSPQVRGTANRYSADYNKHFEIGLQIQMADGGFQLNTSYFFYNHLNQPLLNPRENSYSTEPTARPGRSNTEGVELEFSAALTPRLRLDGFATWQEGRGRSIRAVDMADPAGGNPNWRSVFNLDGSSYIIPVDGHEFDPLACEGAERDEDDPPPEVLLRCQWVFVTHPAGPGGSGIDTESVLVPIGVAQNLRGNETPNTPRLSRRIGIEYEILLPGNITLLPRIDYFYRDAYYSRVFNRARDRVPSTEIIHATVTLYDNRQQWWLQAFLHNAGNKNPVSGIYSSPASRGSTNQAYMFSPRIFGLQLQVQL